MANLTPHNEAPLGAFGMDMTYRKLLSHDSGEEQQA